MTSAKQHGSIPREFKMFKVYVNNAGVGSVEFETKWNYILSIMNNKNNDKIV